MSLTNTQFSQLKEIIIWYLLTAKCDAEIEVQPGKLLMIKENETQQVCVATVQIFLTARHS